MHCFSCGCRLSEYDFCTACGVDVSLYKRIMRISNLYYNEGLAKANLRDLTGAITSLRQSLKFNKNNIEARNLLGLLYFEMGEVVAALSEWVISKNLQPEKNIADDYINMVQSNSSRLDAINQTIKKYNQALTYCMQDSKDLAILQLKKVLSLNGKFIRAHQLLALLYMDISQWEKAKRELIKCAEMDRNNTLTLRYLQEVDKMLISDDNLKVSKRKSEDAIRYQSDNEIIIKPLGISEPKRSGVNSLVNIIIGFLIGMAAMYFLVVPAVRTNVNNESQQKIAEIGNQIDAKNTTIAELESRYSDLQAENDSLHKELDAYVGTDGTLQTIENLLNAATYYIGTQDVEQTAENLETIYQNVVLEDTSEAYQSLYNTLLVAIGPRMSDIYNTQGYALYQVQSYPEAILALYRAVEYNSEN